MVKRMVIAVIVLGVALVNVACASDLTGIYGAARFAYSDQKVTNATLMAPGSEYEFADRDDWNPAGALALGYDFADRFSLPLRVEVEYTMRDTADVSWSGDQGILINAAFNWGFKMEQDVDTLLFNLNYDFKNASPFTPYISAGLGWSFIDVTLKYSDDIGTPPFSTSEDSTEFAWTVGLGCNYRISERLSADLAYRYVDAGEAEVNYQTLSAEADTTLHEVIAGLRYKF